MALKQIDFTVIEDYDIQAFEAEVRMHLKDGWQLHGSMIAFPNHTDDEGTVLAVRYIQAMYKDRTEIKGYSI